MCFQDISYEMILRGACGGAGWPAGSRLWVKWAGPEAGLPLYFLFFEETDLPPAPVFRTAPNAPPRSLVEGASSARTCAPCDRDAPAHRPWIACRPARAGDGGILRQVLGVGVRWISRCLSDPSPVSRYARSTLSHKGRGEAPLFWQTRCPLLPLWEKVPEGRMRGILAIITPPPSSSAHPAR